MLVLLADDNDLVRTLWKEMLQDQMPGIEAAYAVDGLEAVQQARALRPDVIILDLNMPNMNGHEAACAIKAHPETAHIPVIVVSGEPRGEDDEGTRAPWDGYVVKPLSAARLCEEVCRVLRPWPLEPLRPTVSP